MKLYDRIKEISRTVGSGDMTLLGAVPGFSTFDYVYGTGDSFFYTISNGTDYEVGSGTIDGTSLSRNPLATSNGGLIINWPVGVKEVFVTYPADFSVYTVNTQTVDGIALWSDNNILRSASGLAWESPLLSVAGSISGTDTITSDFGNFLSGVYFQNSTDYQTEPFFRNVLDTDTGINGVIGLSGAVDQYMRFESQGAGQVFAGPTATCGSPPCPSGYPVFRYLNSGDIPSFSSDKANYSPADTDYWDSVPTNVTQGLDLLASRDRDKIRTHVDNMVAFTIGSRSGQYLNGGAISGPEVNGELPIGMWTMRTSGDALFIDINTSGIVKTVSLGTAT